MYHSVYACELLRSQMVRISTNTDLNEKTLTNVYRAFVGSIFLKPYFTLIVLK